MYFEEENLFVKDTDSIRIKVIKAIVSDTQTRYAGISKPQKTCRFNIPQKCYKVLNVKFGDKLYVSKQKNSNTSIVITKKEPRDDLEVISKIRFGTGKIEKKNRLRINQSIAKMFGACDIGVSVFSYNNELALRVTPNIPVPDINILTAKNIEEFGKYILWKGRTIKFISFSSKTTPIAVNEFSFKPVGGAYYIKKHDVIGKPDKKFICEGRRCKYCKDLNKYPIHYKALYFPVLINVDTGLSRPGVLKFVNDGIGMTGDILKEYNNYYSKSRNGYWSGNIDYNSKSVWKIESNKKLNIVRMGIKKSFTDAERGWLLSLRADFKKIISEKENISTSCIQNLKIKI